MHVGAGGTGGAAAIEMTSDASRVLVTCVICRVARPRTKTWHASLVGIVCTACWASGRPKTAPYSA